MEMNFEKILTAQNSIETYFIYLSESDLTLSDVGRGGQKGNQSESFQKFSSQKAHFPCGLMDKALDFDTKGP